jgi:hypothetical protein
MSHSARLFGLSLLTIGFGLPIMAAAPNASTQPDAMEVTSDTPAYCTLLLERVSNLMHVLPEARPDATRLSNEGQRLCDQGHIRGGILRLRRAWLLLTQPAR